MFLNLISLCIFLAFWIIKFYDKRWSFLLQFQKTQKTFKCNFVWKAEKFSTNNNSLLSEAKLGHYLQKQAGKTIQIKKYTFRGAGASQQFSTLNSVPSEAPRTSQHSIVLRGRSNWSPMMPRGASLSDSAGCGFSQSGEEGGCPHEQTRLKITYKLIYIHFYIFVYTLYII